MKLHRISFLCALAALVVVPVVAQTPVDFTPSIKTGSDRNGAPLQSGDLIDWTLVISNGGPSDAIDVTVTDRIQFPNDFVDAGTGSYDPATLTVVWNSLNTSSLGLIPPGGSVTLLLTTSINPMAPPPIQACNQGIISVATLPGVDWQTDDPSTPTGSDPTCLPTTAGPASADAVKSVADGDSDGLFEPGELIRYTIDITNTGTVDLTSVQLTDTLPGDLTSYVVVSIPPGAIDDSDLTISMVDVNSFTIPVGSTASVIIEGNIPANPADPSYCNIGYVQSAELSPQPSHPPSAPPPLSGPTCFAIFAAPPSVTGVDPCRGTKRGGTEIRIAGSGFMTGAEVYLGMTPAAVTSVTPTEIVAITGANPPVGSVDVLVRNPDLQEATLVDGWSYTPPPFPIQLKGSKRSGKVFLIWTDTGQGDNTVLRSTDPLFGCGSTATLVSPPPEMEDDVLDDGTLYYYRVD